MISNRLQGFRLKRLGNGNFVVLAGSQSPAAFGVIVFMRFCNMRASSGMVGDKTISCLIFLWGGPDSIPTCSMLPIAQLAGFSDRCVTCTLCARSENLVYRTCKSPFLPKRKAKVVEVLLGTVQELFASKVQLLE